VPLKERCCFYCRRGNVYSFALEHVFFLKYKKYQFFSDAEYYISFIKGIMRGGHYIRDNDRMREGKKKIETKERRKGERRKKERDAGGR
jgi:hypothetical protein